MPRFFIKSGDIKDNKVKLTGDDAHHLLTVLRHKKGDIITLCDGENTDYSCRIEEITKEYALLAVLSNSESAEPSYKAILFQGLVKGEKSDIIIQKAVELGVFEIVFFPSERSVVKIDKKALDGKIKRWQSISASAAKQSGRGIIPKVSFTDSYNKALEQMASKEKSILFYEGNNTVFARELISKRDFSEIGFMIGPEGGFSKKEIETALERNLSLGGLGKLILRTETASGCFLSMLMYELF